jgi:hypothetical protein
MASALLERETLDAEEIKIMLEGGTLEPVAEAEPVAPKKPVEERKPSARPDAEKFPRGIPPLADPDASA